MEPIKPQKQMLFMPFLGPLSHSTLVGATCDYFQPFLEEGGREFPLKSGGLEAQPPINLFILAQFSHNLRNIDKNDQPI